MRQMSNLTPMEIQKAGWEALKKQLGLVGARKELFKNKTVESLIGKMKKEGKV